MIREQLSLWEDEKQISYQADTSWESEVVAFLTAIKSNKPVTIGNSTDALKVMKIVDKIYSYRKNRS